MGLCTQRSNVINKRDRNAMKQLKILEHHDAHGVFNPYICLFTGS